MKNILKLIAPIGIVVILFIGFTSYQKNYDPRYTTSNKGAAIVTKKKIIPEGMYKTSYMINKTVRYTETWRPEQCFVFVMLNGKEHEAITDKQLYSRVKINDEMQVLYQEPKYFGTPFNVTIAKPD